MTYREITDPEQIDFNQDPILSTAYAMPRFQGMLHVLVHSYGVGTILKRAQVWLKTTRSEQECYDYLNRLSQDARVNGYVRTYCNVRKYYQRPT